MNSDDRKALHAFKSMFTALSTSVRKKFEGKKDGDTGSRPHSEAKDHPILHHNEILDSIPYIAVPEGETYVYRKPTPLPCDEPPALRSEALRQSGANVIPFGGKPSTKT